MKEIFTIKFLKSIFNFKALVLLFARMQVLGVIKFVIPLVILLIILGIIAIVAYTRSGKYRGELPESYTKKRSKA